MSVRRLDDLLLDNVVKPVDGAESTASSSTYVTEFIGKAVNCMKVANSIPTEHGYQYLASFPEFTQKTEDIRTRIAKIMGRISSQVSRLHPVPSSTFSDNDDAIRFNALVETVDDAFEQVTKRLKRFRNNGAYEGPILGSTQPLDTTNSLKRKVPELPIALGILAKPQLGFKTPVDNSANPWRPLLREKPNALRPLQDVIINGPSADSKLTTKSYDMSSVQLHLEKQYGLPLVPTDTTEYPHPYSYELDNVEYPASQLRARGARMYKSLAETKCHFVGNVTELEILEQKLNTVTEFAVDLEHHSYRSYLGITCLMQISTRTEDFLVDAIALRDDLHILNSSFTNPSIVKIFHGASMDIQWLQRDLGLYVVNLFDTAHAAKLLNFTSCSLASLLSLYCSVQADKKFQLADWRVRPLSAQMIHYARQDTHFLLFVYDRMKNELIERSSEELRRSLSAPNRFGAQATIRVIQDDASSMQDLTEVPHLLAVCLNRSRDVCLTRYVKPPCDASTVQRIADQIPKMTPVQMRVLSALVFWRDTVARHEDESAGYVLPTTALIQLSLICPQDSSSLRDICRPMTPMLKRYQTQITSMIQRVILSYPTTSSAQPTLAPTLSTSFMDDMPVVETPSSPVLPISKPQVVRALGSLDSLGSTSTSSSTSISSGSNSNSNPNFAIASNAVTGSREEAFDDAGWVASPVHSNADFRFLDSSVQNVPFSTAAEKTANDLMLISAHVFGGGSRRDPVGGVEGFDLMGLSRSIASASSRPYPSLILTNTEENAQNSSETVATISSVGTVFGESIETQTGEGQNSEGSALTSAQKKALEKHAEISQSFSMSSCYTPSTPAAALQASVQAASMATELGWATASPASTVSPTTGNLDIMSSPNASMNGVSGLSSTLSAPSTSSTISNTSSGAGPTFVVTSGAAMGVISSGSMSASTTAPVPGSIAEVYRAAIALKQSDEGRGPQPLRQQKPKKATVNGNGSSNATNGFHSGSILGASDSKFLAEVGWVKGSGTMPSSTPTVSSSIAIGTPSLSSSIESPLAESSGAIVNDGKANTKKNKDALTSNSGANVTTTQQASIVPIVPFVYNEKNEFANANAQSLAHYNSNAKYFNPMTQFGNALAANPNNNNSNNNSGNRRGGKNSTNSHSSRGGTDGKKGVYSGSTSSNTGKGRR